MAVYNYAGGEVNIKVVYYGPGLSGKTTNLEFMYSKLPRENKGKMVSMKTRTDRTLFFDFLPIEVGRIGDLDVRFLLYTVPGQVYYNATRKLVLKGVDAVVFVADSSPDKLNDDKESLQNLEENLNEIGLTLKEVPWVMQYNKRDVPQCMSKELLDTELNTDWKAPVFEAVATTGSGVYETFEAVAKLVFRKLQRDLASKKDQPQEEPEAEGPKRQVKPEVVTQGVSRVHDSEAGESETSGYAEEREEEHESVSEFVDSVLTEGETGGPGAEDLGSTREGYEEYGHMVELGDAAAQQGQAPAAVAVAGANDPKKGCEEKSKPAEIFINDPLEKLEVKEKSAPAQAAAPVEDAAPAPAPEAAAPRTVRVPVVLTEEEARGGAVTVVLDISVEKG